jgi:hypothetical protein
VLLPAGKADYTTPASHGRIVDQMVGWRSGAMVRGLPLDEPGLGGPIVLDVRGVDPQRLKPLPFWYCKIAGLKPCATQSQG